MILVHATVVKNSNSAVMKIKNVGFVGYVTPWLKPPVVIIGYVMTKVLMFCMLMPIIAVTEIMCEELFAVSITVKIT